MDGKLKRQLRFWTITAAASAGAGLAYMPFIAETVTPGLILQFAAQGVLISSLVFGFEIFVIRHPESEKLRRLPFAVVFILKALVTTILIVTAFAIGGWVLFPGRFADGTHLRDLVRDTGYALGVAVVLQFVLMIQAVVGGRVLINLILGRYHKPLREERVFMFLDVSGSTGLAERFGGIGAYSMISRLFFDVAQETVRFGGETHAYVGDEVIVTWPLDRGTRDASCLECYFAILDRIARKAPDYEREFGFVPQFRVGLHGGEIVAGECGDDKREIVYFGDTINTTARIQEACKEFDRPLLVSGDLLAQITLKPIYAATSLGKVKLRGREKEIELFTVQR